MARIASITLLGLSLFAFIGCSAGGNYGSQAYSAPVGNMNPGGAGFPANPTQFQQPGPIASGCGCQSY